MEMTREELKAKAEELGIEYKSNISTEKLLELVSGDVVVTKEVKKETPAIAKTEGQIKAEARKAALELIRVIVTPMDVDKKELAGEIISCGNSFTGMIKKFVYFNTEWHIPKIIYETLRDKKTRVVKDVKVNSMRVQRDEEIPGYSIQVLPPLTQAELDELVQANNKK